MENLCTTLQEQSQQPMTLFHPQLTRQTTGLIFTVSCAHLVIRNDPF